MLEENYKPIYSVNVPIHLQINKNVNLKKI